MKHILLFSFTASLFLHLVLMASMMARQTEAPVLVESVDFEIDSKASVMQEKRGQYSIAPQVLKNSLSESQKSKPPLTSVAAKEQANPPSEQHEQATESSDQEFGEMGDSDLSISQGSQGGIKGVYLSNLRKKISQSQVYPAISRRFGEEGVVRVMLTIDRSGSLTKLELIEGSPFKRLNDAALNAITKASPFDSFPDEIQFHSWRITLPIRFSLTQ